MRLVKNTAQTLLMFLAITLVLTVFQNSLFAGTTHNEKVAQMRAPLRTSKLEERKKSEIPLKTRLNLRDGAWFMALDQEKKLIEVRRIYNRERHKLKGLKSPEDYLKKLEEFYTAYDKSMKHVKMKEALIKMLTKDAK